MIPDESLDLTEGNDWSTAGFSSSTIFELSHISTECNNICLANGFYGDMESFLKPFCLQYITITREKSYLDLLTDQQLYLWERSYSLEDRKSRNNNLKVVEECERRVEVDKVQRWLFIS